MINGYVITKKDDLVSESMADTCIETGLQNNFLISKFYGFYEDLEQHLKNNNLFFNPEGIKKIKTPGVTGCFLSHFALWNKCIIEDKPMAIFEYDAVIINKISDDIIHQFEDYLNLDFARHLYLEDKDVYKSKLIKSTSIKVRALEENLTTTNKNSYKYMNKNHIKGAYGYILKPAGAKKVVAGVLQHGLVPADVAINLRYMKLFYTEPSVVRLNPIMLENLKKLSHTKL
jgi:GR25 family glycosyltransferase involved in LPS biosynthesis